MSQAHPEAAQMIKTITTSHLRLSQYLSPSTVGISSVFDSMASIPTLR